MINLTQHPATPEQVKAGVVDASFPIELLTFDEVPNAKELHDRAESVALLAKGWSQAMIGGAPFFMAALESALLSKGVEPVYAFSRRESAEETQPDGAVVKRNVFRHVGFVRPYGDDPNFAGY